MNELQILSDGIIGSQAEVVRLATAKSAKILVVADTHRNRNGLLEIIQKYGKDCDALFHLGDGVQDILYCLQLAYNEDTIKNALPPVLFIIQGNLDPENCFIVKGKRLNHLAEHDRETLNFLSILFCKICNQNIMLSHGHLSSVKEGLEELAMFARYHKCTLSCFGHTHKVCDTTIHGVRLINPGWLASKQKPNTDKSFILMSLYEKMQPQLTFVSVPYTVH